MMLQLVTVFSVLATCCKFEEHFVSDCLPHGFSIQEKSSIFFGLPYLSSMLFTDSFNAGSTGVARTRLASLSSPWMMPDEVSLGESV
jgi:hypothetical protein